MISQIKKQYGIAIFHNIGDLLLCTPIPRQLKADDPACHITWYTSQRYAFVLNNNPYIDEVIALPDAPLYNLKIINILRPHATQENAGVLALNAEIPRLRNARPWTRFFTPAPYLNFHAFANHYRIPGIDDNLSDPQVASKNGSLLDVIKAYVNFNWTVSDLPVMRLTDAEVARAREYISKLPHGIKILFETEFNSGQSYFDIDCLLKVITSTLHLKPVVIFTSKNKPLYYDDLAKRYERMYWFSGEFRLNAELYNACNGFVGVSSGVSTLTYSDWCRNDLPKLEASLGEHWSAFQRVSHYKLMPCYSKALFMDKVIDYVAMLQGSINSDAEQITIDEDIYNTPCTITDNRESQINNPNPAFNIMPEYRQFSVLYDISVLGLGELYESARTGIYRVVEHIVQGLVASPEIKLAFCATQAISEHSPETITGCRQYLAKNPEFQHIPFFEFDFPSVDIFHSPFHVIPNRINAPVRFLTVYDLIPIMFPQFIPSRVTRLQQITFSQTKCGDQFFCISHTTKKDLCRVVGVASERAMVTHLAADLALFYPCTENQQQIAVREKYNIGLTPYILSLCTLEPRKNIDHVLRAFASLLRKGLAGDTRLVLTGTKGWDFDRIFNEIDNNPELHTRIVLTGYVPDDDLAPLYSGATAFVYMSLYEGFGLPPLEAMQCGVPVITSNTSSLPEVVGDAGIMLDPQDIDGLCRAMHEVITNHALHKEMSKRSLLQAAHFSWDRCVEEIIAAYKNALNNQKGKVSTVREPAIVVDGVIFQLQHGRPFGISRLWLSLLTELAATPLAARIVLLDREGTAPELPGIRRRKISAFCLGNACNEAETLDQVCREEGGRLFISTYYTYTLSTPSLLMLYDMIPERYQTVGPDVPNPEWRDKHHAIENSSSFAAISQSTARDLALFYPQVSSRPKEVIPCAVSDEFRAHSADEIAAFKAAGGLRKSYFLLVGRHDAHKNVRLFFQAFARLPERERYAIVMAGAGHQLKPELRELIAGADDYAGFFSDQDLALLYSGALALVYPSIYEGFGLPILEAMQSGCPVITCHNSSIFEVAGRAALYVGESDVDGLSKTLLDVQQPDVRSYLIEAGLEQAKRFSWKTSAVLLAETINAQLQS
jgi:glycosyltransferase involved in cell wall biosynthesis